MKINFGTYGNYKSSNYSGHCLRLTFGTLTLFFSYQTIVAFDEDNGDGTIVVANRWGPTTGKHLNWIDGGNKARRLPKDKFDAALALVLEKHDLVIK